MGTNTAFDFKRDLGAFHIATRRDSAEADARLRDDLREMEPRLRRQFGKACKRFERRLTVRLVGAIAASIAIVAALVKVL